MSEDPRTTGEVPTGTGAPEEAMVVVDRGDLDQLLAEARAEGVEVTVVEESGFLDPVTATVLLFGGAAAVGTVMYALEVRKGGQVFDLRPNAPRQAYRSKDVAYGLVLLIAPDGKVTVEVKEPKGAFGIVVDALRGAVVDLAKPAADGVKAAAEKAVGNRGTVTVEPVSA